MKLTLPLLTALLLAPLAALHAAETDPTFDKLPRDGDLVDWVDPIIGTQSARWFFFTPAAAPFVAAEPRRKAPFRVIYSNDLTN